MAAVNDPSSRRCDETRIALGAYVLGSLDPAERADVEQHLAGCAPCREDLSELAFVPGLLARTTIDDLRAADAVSVTAQADRAVHELARRRRAARRRRLLAAAAAVVILGTGAGVGIAVSAGGPGSRLTATSESTGVSARVDIAVASTGTAVSLRLTGVAPGEHCKLVAVSANGTEETAASWVATYQGKATVRGETAIARADLASLRVVTDAGAQLVTIPVRKD